MTKTLQLPKVVESPISRLDPRWRVSGLLLAIIIASFLKTFPSTLGSLIQGLILILIARLSLSDYLDRLGNLFLGLLIFLLPLPFLVPGKPLIPWWTSLPVSMEGVWLAVTIGLRAAAIVTLGLVLISTGKADSDLKACRALGMPSLFLQIGLLTGRYLILLMDELKRLRTALRIRGFRNRPNLHSYRLIGNLTGVLIVRAGERSERVSQAMAARGFDGTFRSLTRFQTRNNDIIFFIAIVMVQLFLLWADWQTR